MEFVKTWLPLIASAVAILISFLNWRFSRKLQYLKTTMDFEKEALLKQIDSAIEIHAEKRELTKDAAAHRAEIASQALMAIQRYKDCLSVVIRTVKVRDFSDVESIMSDVEEARELLAEAHSSAYAKVRDLGKDDLKPLHELKAASLVHISVIKDVLIREEGIEHQIDESLRALGALRNKATETQGKLKALFG